MANIQSNVKRNLQSKERNLLVHSQISTMKTYIKKAQKTREKKDLDRAYSCIDSALAKGIIKQNKADRLKSRLALHVQGTVKVAAKVEKKVVKKEAPKITEESLKRENQELKVVDKKEKKENEEAEAEEETEIIMISTTPEQAEAILTNPKKNVFFYKVTPANKVKRVLVYATSPVQAVVGEFDLERIHIVALSTAWVQHGSASSLTRKEYEKYFEGHKKAHAMIAKETFKYSKPKNLESFGMKKGPSGFQYLK